MKRKITDTTFGKLTVAYLLFGVIPLFLISLLFFCLLYTSDAADE